MSSFGTAPSTRLVSSNHHSKISAGPTSRAVEGHMLSSASAAQSSGPGAGSRHLGNHSAAGARLGPSPNTSPSGRGLTTGKRTSASGVSPKNTKGKENARPTTSTQPKPSTSGAKTSSGIPMAKTSAKTNISEKSRLTQPKAHLPSVPLSQKSAAHQNARTTSGGLTAPTASSLMKAKLATSTSASSKPSAASTSSTTSSKTLKKPISGPLASAKAKSTSPTGPSKPVATRASIKSQPARRRVVAATTTNVDPSPPANMNFEDEVFDNSNLEDILDSGSAVELDSVEERRGTLFDKSGAIKARISMGPVRRTTAYGVSSVKELDRVQKRASIYAGAVRVKRKDVAPPPNTSDDIAKASAFQKAAGLSSIPSAYAMEAYMNNPSLVNVNPATSTNTITQDSISANTTSAPQPASEPPLAKLQRGMDDYFNRHQNNGNIQETVQSQQPAIALPSTSAVVGSVIASIGALNPRTPGRANSGNILDTPMRIAQQNTARRAGMIVQDLLGTPKSLGPAKRLFNNVNGNDGGSGSGLFANGLDNKPVPRSEEFASASSLPAFPKSEASVLMVNGAQPSQRDNLFYRQNQTSNPHTLAVSEPAPPTLSQSSWPAPSALPRFDQLKKAASFGSGGTPNRLPAMLPNPFEILGIEPKSKPSTVPSLTQQSSFSSVTSQESANTSFYNNSSSLLSKATPELTQISNLIQPRPGMDSTGGYQVPHNMQPLGTSYVTNNMVAPAAEPAWVKVQGRRGGNEQIYTASASKQGFATSSYPQAGTLVSAVSEGSSLLTTDSNWRDIVGLSTGASQSEPSVSKVPASSSLSINRLINNEQPSTLPLLRQVSLVEADTPLPALQAPLNPNQYLAYPSSTAPSTSNTSHNVLPEPLLQTYPAVSNVAPTIPPLQTSAADLSTLIAAELDPAIAATLEHPHQIEAPSEIENENVEPHAHHEDDNADIQQLQSEIEKLADLEKLLEKEIMEMEGLTLEEAQALLAGGNDEL
ncbi:hypothetical protein HDV05_001557 [Chytridiales sp. JEL 0842]|nr:hypothetical protein HDV05_001557 [Chytridiales sp. JEL 0842]